MSRIVTVTRRYDQGEMHCADTRLYVSPPPHFNPPPKFGLRNWHLVANPNPEAVLRADGEIVRIGIDPRLRRRGAIRIRNGDDSVQKISDGLTQTCVW